MASLRYMPPKKNTTTKRQVSDAHKAAMAAGREAGRAVNTYLHALEENRPKRGRKVSKADLEKRLTEARQRSDEAVGTARLLALQLVEDLESRIKQLSAVATDNLSELEDGFAKAAKAYGEAKGISYSTWRSVGVPVELLKKAGISRGNAQ
jgi:hypothetical protein